MVSIPGNTGRHFTVLRENDRLFQHFTRFGVDFLLNSNDAGNAFNVTLGPLDCLVGGFEIHLPALNEPSPLLFSNCWTM
jgi:hypothetical protein